MSQVPSSTAAKQQILAALRKNLPQATALPTLDQDWTTYEDPVEHFGTVLRSVGGEVLEITSVEQARQEVEQLIQELNAKQIGSLLPYLTTGNRALRAEDDPHQLADIDLAILPGRLGVAENAAIWVAGADLPQRAILFIAQHVLLALPRSAIVNNLHEAYAQLEWTNTPFGVFVSGPSKTADIEQSLVIGAHGARSMTVFLLPDDFPSQM